MKETTPLLVDHHLSSNAVVVNIQQPRQPILTSKDRYAIRSKKTDPKKPTLLWEESNVLQIIFSFLPLEIALDEEGKLQRSDLFNLLRCSAYFYYAITQIEHFQQKIDIVKLAWELRQEFPKIDGELKALKNNSCDHPITQQYHKIFMGDLQNVWKSRISSTFESCLNSFQSTPTANKPIRDKNKFEAISLFLNDVTSATKIASAQIRNQNIWGAARCFFIFLFIGGFGACPQYGAIKMWQVVATADANDAFSTFLLAAFFQLLAVACAFIAISSGLMDGAEYILKAIFPKSRSCCSAEKKQIKNYYSICHFFDRTEQLSNKFKEQCDADIRRRTKSSAAVNHQM